MVARQFRRGSARRMVHACRMTAAARLHRLEWLLFASALLLPGLALGYLLRASYREIDTIERDRLQVQARVIENNLGRQVEAVDQALLVFENALSAPGAGRGELRMSGLLTALHRTIPGLKMLVHVGADGTVLGASREDQVGTHRGERPYFKKRMQAQPDPSVLHVAEPYTDADGQPTIALVRTLTGPAGEFAGVVAASLEPAYFNTLLRSVLYAPDMRAALMHANGDVFLTVPPNGPTLGTNADRPGSFFRRHLDSGLPATLVRGETAAGVDRMVALRTLQRADLHIDRPLVIAVGRDAAAIFGPWQRNAQINVGLYALYALTACLGLLMLHRRRHADDRATAVHAAALNVSEARFRSLVRLSSDWYWEQDAAFRFVQTASERESPTRISMEGYIGRTRWDVPALNLTPADWVQHRALLEAHHEFRDFVMTRPNGESGPRWVSVSGEPIFDASGGFCGYRGTGRDITEQRLAEEALRRSDERLRLILRGSHDAPWDLDVPSGRLWLAEPWQTMLGWRPGDTQLNPQMWQERCHPADAAPAAALFRAAIKSRDADYQLEMRLRHRDGRYVAMLMRGFILRDASGRATRVSGVNTDLTERKQAEAERQRWARGLAEQQLRRVELAAAERARLQAEQHAQGLVALLAERDRTLGERDRLLALLAHEIRQPLHNASAALQSAAMAVTDPQLSPPAALGRLERAQCVLDQVTGTVDNALSASVLLTDAQHITTQDVEIDTLLALAIADLGAAARTRVQTRRVTRSRTAELNIALMRLALRNLLANALAYSPDNAVVQLAVDHSDDPLALVVDIADSGDGIAPELLPTLFERGTRGANAEQVAGAGLGLYVVARVVALHYGRVEVRANAPRGTCIRLVLPQGRLDGAAAAPSHALSPNA